MKEQVQSRGHPSQILVDAALGCPVEVRAHMGGTDVVKRALRWERSKGHPPNPDSASDLTIPEEWKVTGGPNPETFLIHDNGVGSSNRILVYAADKSLQHLASARTWMMDGTFEVAPRIFTQLFVIRAPLGSSSVSCAYAFLSNKSEASYKEAIHSVVNRCSMPGFNPNPMTVLTDFEIAMGSAITSVLGDHVQTKGCFYHLTQSTWRKMQTLGLVRRYKQDQEIQHFCGMLDGLALIPVDQVGAGMEYLRSIVPQPLEPLVEYFDSTYVNGHFRRAQQPRTENNEVPAIFMQRVPPRYPPAQWNFYETTLAGGYRTNNLCEAWNRAIAMVVGHAHPTIWTAISAIQKDTADVLFQLFQDSRGTLPVKRVRRETITQQDRLFNLLSSFRNNERSLIDTLRGIGHAIRLANV